MVLRVILFATLVAQSLSYPAQPSSTFERDPEEIGGYFEGDMDLDSIQQRSIETPSSRNGLLNPLYNWVDNVLFYEIDSVFDDEHRNHIIKGIKLLEEVSCLRFYPRTPYTKDYVVVTGANSGCHSSVGRRGGRQTLNLQIYPVDTGCFRLGTIVHEFLHALGFYHQQSTYDRDDFVTIVEENIQAGTAHNFNKYSTTVVTDFGVPYDYDSVMHYSSLAFSKNGEMTIVPKSPEIQIGQRLKLSDGDIEKLNIKYKCPVIPNLLN